MGRPPCCDKVGVRRGPWTPEEDIILVSYIQEHGPGNWRSVPLNTGLRRCSKSCRLRWTNYLRPGIKRGNFTPDEEAVIVRLQSLLGNRWAAIASYLPRRTDNDIKNYWNTHFKKKLRKQQAMGAIFAPSSSSAESAGHLDHHHHDMVDLDGARAACSNPEASAQMISTRRRSPIAADGDCSSSSYASSVGNISKLLNGFMKSSTTQSVAAADVKPGLDVEINPFLSLDPMSGTGASSAELTFTAGVQQQQPPPALMRRVSSHADDETKQQQQAPLSSIEKWLFDEAAEELSDGCCSIPLF